MGREPSKIGLLLGVSKALIRDRKTRRQIMFYVTLLTMVLIFMGTVALSGVLAKSNVLFASYWILCFGFAFFMLLLALYDILMLQHSRAKRDDAELQRALAKIIEDNKEPSEREK